MKVLNRPIGTCNAVAKHHDQSSAGRDPLEDGPYDMGRPSHRASRPGGEARLLLVFFYSCSSL